LADEKIVYYSPHTLEIKKLPALSTEVLAGYFNEPQLRTATNREDLVKCIGRNQYPGFTVLLWMSSGRFDGLNVQDTSRQFFEGQG
jgi:UDP-N-acetylmuramate: L-alanyl-gamma-D-glutamyl-meso-diaminopimelate ligase